MKSWLVIIFIGACIVLGARFIAQDQKNSYIKTCIDAGYPENKCAFFYLNNQTINNQDQDLAVGHGPGIYDGALKL